MAGEILTGQTPALITLRNQVVCVKGPADKEGFVAPETTEKPVDGPVVEDSHEYKNTPYYNLQDGYFYL